MLKVLIPPKAISLRIGQLAAEIEQIVTGNMDVLILIKGAFVFGADLIRSLSQIRSIHFARPKSYHGHATTPGSLTWQWPEDLVSQAKTLLIVDDILDSGSTMKEAGELARKCGYERVLYAVLLRKVRSSAPITEAHFVGFEIPDLFVVGYGLDFNENYRALPYIGVIEDPDAGTLSNSKITHLGANGLGAAI